MSFAEKIWVHIFAIGVQLPFHLLLASPWLIVAVGVMYFTRHRYSLRTRIILGTGFAAIGFAPVYGSHLSIIPIYILTISGSAQFGLGTILSFVVTWGVLLSISMVCMLVVSNYKDNRFDPEEKRSSGSSK